MYYISKIDSELSINIQITSLIIKNDYTYF